MISETLFLNKDEKYAAFQSKLMPTVEKENIIGVRTPVLRKFAKEIKGSEEAEKFLKNLPHKYFDENQLHSFLVCEEKDFALCIKKVEEFLPYIDNWATCDQLSPKVFKKHREELVPYIKKWLNSDKTYTLRFAIGLIMEFLLDDCFKVEYLVLAANIRSEEYYVNMQTAWLFATALCKHYEETLPFLLEKRLDKWTHNKTIQKARESLRITKEQKEFLNTLKIR